MDASQYKDYILTLLFVKYVSDKAENNPDALIEIPQGASFSDYISLKNDKEIGDKINKINAKLVESNEDLVGVIDPGTVDFNDENSAPKEKQAKIEDNGDLSANINRLLSSPSSKCTFSPSSYQSPTKRVPSPRKLGSPLKKLTFPLTPVSSSTNMSIKLVLSCFISMGELVKSCVGMEFITFVGKNLMATEFVF